ncbi:MAG: 23S rRNA (uracil(1939)-C(5))-methyltransferase RlmD [Anaerolineae bacterium]
MPKRERPAGDSIVLELESLAHGGMALGKTAGRVFFVPYGAPGDRVRVRIVEDHGSWAKAHIVDILRPSPHRVMPPCPYYPHCSGCQLQHIAYEKQVSEKRHIVEDQLARLAHLRGVRVEPVAYMEEPWRYRNFAQLYPTPEGGLGIRTSFHAGTAPIEDCLLFHPLLQEMYEVLDIEAERLRRLTLRAGTRTGDQLVIFETEEGWVPHLSTDLPIACALDEGKEVRALIGSPWIWEEIAGRRFRISALSPFPPNSDMAEHMLDLVYDYLSPEPEDILLDLGCGVGLFSLSFVEDVAGVVAVEDNPWAVNDFVVNAGEAPAGVIFGSLAEGLEEVPGPVDLAVLTPPHEGIDQTAAAKLGRLAPRRLVYYAADVAALAHDVRFLQDAGFSLVEVQPLDMTPHAYLISVLALWERRRGG